MLRLLPLVLIVSTYRVGCDCGPSPIELPDAGGSPDASVDAGIDAGGSVDSGSADSGSPDASVDAGGSTDSGVADSGAPDASVDAGVDAGGSGTADSGVGDSGASDASVTYQLVFTTQPVSPASAGAAIANGPVVEVQTNLGQRVSSGGLATASIELTDSSTNGVLAGATQRTAVGGVASFLAGNLVFEKAGTTALRATTAVAGFGTLTALSVAVTVPAPVFSSVSALSGPNDPNGDIDGTAFTARLWLPSGLTSDGTYLYISEQPPACVIRRYTISTGDVTTWAGTLYSCGHTDGVSGANTVTSSPSMATDSTYVYFSDGNAVRRAAISNGAVSTLAGNKTAGYLDDPNGLNARFSEISSLLIHGTTLYVGDSGNKRIRGVDLSASPYAVTTIAGNGSATLSDNVNPLLAGVGSVDSLASDGTNLYFVDGKSIRHIVLPVGATVTDSSDVKDLVCGGASPGSIAVLGTSFFFACQTTVRRAVIGSWTWTLQLGKDWTNSEVDGPGASSGIGIVTLFPLAPNLYVSDSSNGTLRVMNNANVLTTLAGTPDAGNGWVMNTAGASTRFEALQDLISDGTNLYGFDFETNNMPIISPANGASAPAVGSGWGLQSPYSQVLTLVDRTIYYLDPAKIWTIDPAAPALTAIAGDNSDPRELEGSFSTARFTSLDGIVSDQSNVYVFDNFALKKLDLATKTVSVLSGSPGSAGCVLGNAATSRYTGTFSIAYAAGKLYFWQSCFNYAIVQVDTTTGASVAFSGIGTAGYQNGSGATAQFAGDGFAGLPLTSDGLALYALDSSNAAVRAISLTDGSVSTLYGGPTSRWETDGPLATAQEGPASVENRRSIYYGFGRLYVVTGRGIRVVR